MLIDSPRLTAVPWPSEIQVVTPTVVARRATRAHTLDQWRAIGAAPIVVEQLAYVPYGRRGTRVTASRAVARGLATDAPWVLYAEDDIDLDPRIPQLLPWMLEDTPLTLWHRPRFVPARLRTLPPGRVAVAPLIGQAHWFGSLALLLPRPVAALIANTPPAADDRGWDLHVRDTLAAHQIRLRLVVPSLVEHRDLPRIATRSGPRHITSTDYQGPRP